ncbi:MAG: tetratricopeptide repeat protein [Planctomycetaceae bacterium]
MSTPDQLYDEAHALKEQGDLEAAVAKLQEVLAIDERHVLTHAALAVHLQRLGRFEDAINHARRVTELEPNDPFSFTQLSVIYQRCGRIPEAEDAMDQARRL